MRRKPTSYVENLIIERDSGRGVGLKLLDEYRDKWKQEFAAGNGPMPTLKRVVSTFGITREDGIEDIMTWVVTGDREHGYVGKKDVISKHNKDMFESMFKGWG